MEPDEEYEEEEDDSETPEERDARMKRARNKMDKFMGELGEELLSPKEYENLVAFIRKALKGLGFTVMHLKAYFEGFTFGIQVRGDIGNQLPLVIGGLRRMIAAEEKKVKDKARDATGI